jgi:hypothetical protein
VDDVVRAVTFPIDVPLFLSRPVDKDRFIPENEEEKQLERLGTDQPYSETSLQFHSRAFNARVDADGVTALLRNPVGSDCMRMPESSRFDVAQFRELWRVLESAFASSDEKLVKLLANYPPAQQLGFDAEELGELHILRGRASHAQSKAGMRELIAVERECGLRLARLKNLVERVTLTKKTWGYPTIVVEELAPLRQYVGRKG